MARRGFFHITSMVSKAPVSTVPKCGVCALYKTCQSPKMPYTGKGRRKILIVAEAPGREEDEAGRQLVGNSGKALMTCLKACGVDMRKDCWLTNALICRPPGNKIPHKKYITYCQPNLRNTIAELKPEIIIPLGGVAVHSLISMVWRADKIGSITRWVGHQIPCQKLNAWICPTFHPSYLLRLNNPVANGMFSDHLMAACELDGVPWPDGIPDYKQDVEIILDDKEAARIIGEMISIGGRVAFDYETNMLKPDSEIAEIVCCSVCHNGERTIAYPWYGAAIAATKRLLKSDLGKIAANIKFEERWSKAILKTGVNNWDWCTMTASHWLDPRKGINSIKFQSFVELGLEQYNDEVEPFLKSDGSNIPNRVKECDLKKLLLYCGLDSLLEYVVSDIQKAKNGTP
jgi:uracil-DNA glycosylase family 4